MISLRAVLNEWNGEEGTSCGWSLSEAVGLELVDGYAEGREREGQGGRQPNRRSSYTEPWVPLSSLGVCICPAALLLRCSLIIGSIRPAAYLTSPRSLARSPGQSLAAAAADGYLLSFSFPVRPHSPPQTSVSDGVMSEVVQSDSMGLKSSPNIGKGSQRLGVSLHDFLRVNRAGLNGSSQVRLT